MPLGGCLSYVISHDLMLCMLKVMYLSVDVHPYPHNNYGDMDAHYYKDCIYRFAKTCAIVALLTYNKIMSTHYFTNNLQDLAYRSHTPDNNVSYS